MKTHPVHYGRRVYREEYLKYDEWQKLRQSALRKAGHRCVKCDAPACDVHHMDSKILATFTRNVHEYIVAVCRDCHNLIEDAKKCGLLPESHNIVAVMQMRPELLASWKRAKKKKIPLLEKHVEVIARGTIQGRRLIAGVLKETIHNPASLLGREVTASQYWRIMAIIDRHIDKVTSNVSDVKRLTQHLRYNRINERRKATAFSRKAREIKNACGKLDISSYRKYEAANPSLSEY